MLQLSVPSYRLEKYLLLAVRIILSRQQSKWKKEMKFF